MSDGDDGVFRRCYCTGVERAAVIAAWRAGARTIAALRTALGVCGGCATCRPEVERLLEWLEEREGR